MSHVLVTGAAGFIGYHLSLRLLQDGCNVHGIDSLNDYYDVQLKLDRLSQLNGQARFHFEKVDLTDRAALVSIFKKQAFDFVVHLAAQAGVRYSLVNPHSYVDCNVVGFVNVLEACRHHQIKHLVYASSSSVYGANRKMPFSTKDRVDHPVSLYAATKKANELMAHTYSHLYSLPATGLRFFTVYGPWGRPDMATFLFTKAILNERPIDVFNHGQMRRDFTYVDDIVNGIVCVVDRIPQSDSGWSVEEGVPSRSSAPYCVYNIGNHKPIELTYFIEVLEKCLGREARKNLLPIQPGDVPETYADIEDLTLDVGFQPSTSIEVGLQKFVEWYRAYYRVD